jgi:hypothetical protein
VVDAGQTAVLGAEQMAFGGTTLDEPVDRAAVGRVIAAVTSGPWWSSCAAPVAVETPRRGTRSSSARRRVDGLEIRVSDEQLTIATAAHELAHALAGIDHGHDGTFRAAYVDVVAMVGGASAAGALTEAFEAMGIAMAGRRWPAPYRAEGDGFVISAGSASVASAVSPSTLTATPMRRSR